MCVVARALLYITLLLVCRICRYKQEMKSYAPAPASEEEDGDTPKKKKRAKKDKNAPKNALSAYIIFTTEQRSKVPGSLLGTVDLNNNSCRY